MGAGAEPGGPGRGGGRLLRTAAGGGDGGRRDAVRGSRRELARHWPRFTRPRPDLVVRARGRRRDAAGGGGPARRLATGEGRDLAVPFERAVRETAGRPRGVPRLRPRSRAVLGRAGWRGRRLA